MGIIMRFVGIDIGKRACVASVVDERGNVLKTTEYANTREGVNEFLDMLLSEYGACSAVCESTARMWIKTYEEFEKRNVPITLANPFKLKLKQSGLKTDKVDSIKLAQRLRNNDIEASHVPGPETRRIIDILRHRVLLVRERTRYLNRQHSLLEKYDFKVMSGNGATSGEKHQAYLDGLKLGPGDTFLMGQYVESVRRINEQIELAESLINVDAYGNEYVQRIMTIPGFGAFSAMLVAAHIDDIDRLDNYKQLVSSMGLCPRVYQSGASVKHGRMKKDRDGLLTWVMMQAAMTAARYDDHLKKLYEHYRKRHSKLVARSHVANKLAVYIYTMLKNDEPYKFGDSATYERKRAVLKASLKSA